MTKGLTAQYLLKAAYRVAAGDTILVHAAAGGVGRLLTQWARHLGCRVIGGVSSDAKAEAARAICHHVIVSAREDIAARAWALTAGRGVAVVYDSVGMDTFDASLLSLEPHGHLVSFGSSSGPAQAFDLFQLNRLGSLHVTSPGFAWFVRSRDELLACSSDLFSVVLTIGAMVGAVNGFFVAVLRMQSIVVTLSTLFVVQGLALLVRATPGGSVPQSFTSFFSGGAIPNLLPAPLIVLAIAIAIWLLMRNTPFGTAIYAVESDVGAAMSSGVRVGRTKFWAYVISGVFYAAAGIFIAAQTGGRDPLVGRPMLLQVFTAVVLGGAVLGGGRGGLVGAVIGAYLLMLFVNVLLILDVPAYYSPMTDGAILLLAVLAGSKWRDEGSPPWNARELARSWTARGRAALSELAPIDLSAREADPQNTWWRRNQETLRSMLPAHIALVVVVATTAVYFGGVAGKYFGTLLVLPSFFGFPAFG